MGLDVKPEFYLWIGVLIGVFILFWIGVTLARRHLAERTDVQPAPPITLASAERMRDEGRLSDDEYRAVRDAIISAASRADDPKTAAARAQAESLRPKKPLPERTAKPGFDLAGDPLPSPSPTPDEGDNPGENAARPDTD